MQHQKRTLEAVLSYDFSKADTLSKTRQHSKLVLTRTNSADIRHTPQNAFELFSSDRPSFRKNRKPIENQSFQNTLEPELESDKSFMMASYGVSPYPTELNDRVEKRISKKRSKYNQYRDFDAIEYERKEKRFFGQMGYFCTLLVLICIVAVYLKAASTKLPVSEPMIVGQNHIISSQMAQDVDISSFLLPNESITKEMLAKKIAEMRRQILRSSYR